jgi:folate-binding protein YgfZ
MSLHLDGVVALPHLGVIRVDGEDAASFLHNQLTQDFALLGEAEARLAAFCNAKGRMLASFVGFKRGPQQVLLVCSRDLLAPTLKRLSMFVLRAKAKLSDASEELPVHGVAGQALAQLAGGQSTPWMRTEAAQGSLLHLYPAQGQARALLVPQPGASAPAGPALPLHLWQLGEVHSGVATLSAPVVEAFVPQMLNFESVGGVNFKKGCYPGQEVVARSQFRGTLKRRAYIARCEAQLAPAQEVFQPDAPDQPVGTVVQAAPNLEGGWDAIVSLQIAAAEGGGLRAGSATGAALHLQQLPYLLLADV